MRSRNSSQSTQLRGPHVQHAYAAVYVLLLSWENDDLGVRTEIDQLASVFGQAYGFLVERSLIPDKEPDRALEKTLESFVKRFESPRSLLIVYYGGHGTLNDARLGLWSCTPRYNSPTVKWYSHQRLIEDSTADVLLLLDCCQPLGGGGSVRTNTGKEVLAACGFGREAPDVGEHSFSRALIEELLKSATHSFTTSELHLRMVNRLRSWIPDWYGERRETPILGILGEGGIPSTSIRLASYTVHPVNLIALMGNTGSGKSSLINRVCGKQVAEVGKGQESKTKEVMHYTTIINREVVTLIDTPGFDDTYLTDRQILERISTYLFEHYQSGRKLNGLLYLRDINLDRMTGSARKNLDLFVRLCGNDSLRNVQLLTTKWDGTPEMAKSEEHEQELISKFWAPMIDLGCLFPKRLARSVNPLSNAVDPISDIIVPMLRFKPAWLQIQRELAEGSQLSNTSAGQYVDQELLAIISEKTKGAESALYQAEEASQRKVKEALTKQAEDLQCDVREAEKDKVALTEDFEKVRKAEAERRAQLFGYGLLDRLDTYALVLDADGKEIRSWTATLASVGLFQACKYIWKKQGVSPRLINSAKDAIYSIS